MAITYRNQPVGSRLLRAVGHPMKDNNRKVAPDRNKTMRSVGGRRRGRRR